MIDAQRNWNKAKGGERQMWKTVTRMLRMEGIEDVINEKLINNKNGYDGRDIVVKSIKWSNLQGVNVPYPREQAVVFRSLVVTVKLQDAFDASLETETVNFLDSVTPQN
ncbi:hypothetical protein BLNAU_4713 [Blattamonas nauphoetae]|uniref:Uncharacterized protein n=1 Tax=Blattamonas nauphoetae TaxID=2049346 RepID=A0ABQ9Y8T8_9EUKA|nr:hypothetical protein BLNAU_4713 [Blattamonas nauphoetae]